jgi:hypothetical protein
MKNLIVNADDLARSGAQIRMCLIIASDGPRIMLFAFMEVDLLPLKQFFLDLSKLGEPIQLEGQPFITSLGDVALSVKYSTADSKTRQRLARVKQETSSFEWTLSADQCDVIAEMIDALMESKKPGHQYLTNYPADAATVVVSKGEYSDEIFKANS